MSATSAVNSFASSEYPAVTIGMRRCGDGATSSGPRTLKNAPSCSIRCIPARSNMTPLSLSRTKASGSQLASRPRSTCTNSRARACRSGEGAMVSNP